MKFVTFIFLFILNSCSQNLPDGPNDGSPDLSTFDKNDTMDLSDDARPDLDVSMDVSMDDIKSDADMVYTPPNFPDPNRENQESCENHFDCNRISACMGGTCHQRATGCGWFARPPPFRADGCLLNKYGTGQGATAECEEDSDCPSNMPNCILKMCQVNARCDVDSDCVGEQFCDYDTWCALRAPCEGENKRCWRGGCEDDGEFCSYPPRDE